MSKIFGIGLSRTGTTSLTKALEILGYTAIHFPISLAEIEAHDASTDTPVAVGFQFLDLMHPGSKFIYTKRPLDSWLSSCKRFFGTGCGNGYTSKIRMAVYGQTVFDEIGFANAMARYEQKVNDYFANRKTDLLVLELGSGWKPLCEFLQKPIPAIPYPHENRAIKPSEQADNSISA